MQTTLVLTAIGDDRPGLVEELARTISSQGGNWLESSMSRLGGKFAGIVRVEIADEKLAALQAALDGFAPLQIVHGTSQVSAESSSGRRFVLNLMGHDRVGIVREVSQVLAKHALNVESLHTYTSAAPMSGETLFHAEAELQTGPSLDEAQLQRDLEALSAELVVEIQLQDAPV